MAQKVYVDFNGLSHYDEKVKAYIAEKDTKVLSDAKAYSDSLAENYEAAGVAATKVAELANGAVKANTDAIAKLNGDATTEGSVAKAVADAKTLIDADVDAVEGKADAAQAAADAADAKAVALAGKVGEVPEGSTVMGIITNIQENAYDDTELRGLIGDNTDAIDAVEARTTEAEAKLTALIGEDAGKSARTIANEELAKQLIAEGAKESLDTLEEIAAWIQAHPDDASAMNKAISDLATLVGTLPEGVSATTIVGYIQEAVAAEKSRAEGVENGLDNRLQAVENKLGSGEGSVASMIAAAKSEAITEAVNQATAKDTQVLTDAKAYTDKKVGEIDLTGITANAGKISALEGRMTTAEGDIDALEAAIAEGGSVATAIAEAKKAGTDAQGEVDALEGVVEALSQKVTTNEGHCSAVADRVTALEEKVGDGFVAITNAQIDGLFA